MPVYVILITNSNLILYSYVYLSEYYFRLQFDQSVRYNFFFAREDGHALLGKLITKTQGHQREEDKPVIERPTRPDFSHLLSPQIWRIDISVLHISRRSMDFEGLTLGIVRSDTTHFWDSHQLHACKNERALLSRSIHENPCLICGCSEYKSRNVNLLFWLLKGRRTVRPKNLLKRNR